MGRTEASCYRRRRLRAKSMSSCGPESAAPLPEGANLGAQRLQQALIVSDPFADLAPQALMAFRFDHVSDKPGTFPSEEPISATGQVIRAGHSQRVLGPASSMMIAPARSVRLAPHRCNA